MLDRKEIDGEIAKWEALDSSYPNYFKLATLYTVRDHMNTESRSFDGVGYSSAAAPPQTETVDVYGDSDFLQAIAGKDIGAVLGIIDDLMDTLQVVNERAYNGVMRKINGLEKVAKI